MAASDAETNNPNTTANPDNVLRALAMDLADGSIGGQMGTTAISDLSDVADIGAIVTTDVSLLMIPGTDTPVSAIEQLLVSERATTNIDVDTTNIESGDLTVDLVAARLISDIDGDEISDRLDAFPMDASESVDTDMDGTGNNADPDDDNDDVADVDDAFSLDPNESEDSDDDGTGNNADTDDDNDGVLDVDDNLPLDPRGSVANSSMIGPEGGVVRSADGLMTLTFPPNAVSEITEITIGAAAAAVSAEYDSEKLPLESHYLLGPDGLQFAEPVEMTWSVPSTSSQPGSIRLVFTESGSPTGARIVEPPEGRIVNNPQNGTVTASINHFSDLFIFSARGVLGINQPTATVGNQLHWNYNFELQDNDYSGFFRTEGAGIVDDSGIAAITRHPELLIGDTIITPPLHDSVVHCDFSYDVGDEDLTFDCAPTTSGNISATCLDGSEEGLRARIGFNFEFDGSVRRGVARLLLPEARVLLRVEADGICKDSVVITEPSFISIGNDIDRITEAPEGLILDDCDSSAQPYFAVASNTQISVTNASGSCSRTLNYPASDNSRFGALILLADAAQRLFIYGESGVFITELIDGVFGELSDFTSTTTDAQFSVNNDGRENHNQAYTVANTGLIKFRTLDGNGLNTNETVFNAFSATGRSFIGYAPVTSTRGIGITSADPSRAYYVDLDANSATEIGEVGTTALGISCERLSCDIGETSCSVTNDETVGCVVSAFDSEELHPFITTDILAQGAAPTFNFSAPIPGIRTASPYTRSNAQGQLVIATVNSNEIGKVMFTIRDAEGVEIQTAEFFLTDYAEAIGFTGTGSSIVMIDPSPEFPNGAVKLSVDNPNGTDDGVLTIPVTEALLGTSPVPFFGTAFSSE